MQKTFSILKPYTVKAGNIGAILAVLEKERFHIRALKMLHLTTREAEGSITFTRSGRFLASL